MTAHSASPDLREALDRAHSILEWIGTEIDDYKHGDRRRRPDYEAWSKATNDGRDRIEAALQASPAPLDADTIHDAMVERGWSCSGTHAIGAALCQDIAALVSELLAARLQSSFESGLEGHSEHVESAGSPGFEFIDLRIPRLTLGERFEALASEWHRETDWLSSVQQKVMHPAYQRMIGLGPEALPLIIEELRVRPAYWFWALAAITGEDPAAGTRTFSAARAAWLDWAGQHNY